MVVVELMVVVGLVLVILHGPIVGHGATVVVALWYLL